MAHDLQLDLDVLLPNAHDHRDQCVSELLSVLAATDGVDDAHLIPPADGHPARLCMSVEAGRVSLRRLTERARSAGVQISARYGHVVWQLRDISHSTRASNASAVLQRLPGVLDAVVATGGLARIEFDRTITNEASLLDEARDAGVTVVDRQGDGELHQRATQAGIGQPFGASIDGQQVAGRPDRHPLDHRHGPPEHRHGKDASDTHRGHSRADGGGHQHDGGHEHGDSNRELIVAAGAFATYVVALALDWTTGLEHVPTALYVIVTVVTGWMVGRDVLATLRVGRFDIEMLMLAAAVGAATLGNWADSALLLALFSLGHGLESFAMARARSEIESLGELAPPVAHRRRPDGSTEDVATDSIAVADVLLIKPNERIAADGVVVSGSSAVDEAPVTGESTPVEKSPIAAEGHHADFESIASQHRVFSGTLNGHGALEVFVVRTAQDSTLARVVRLVAEAETQISPTQRRTQRIVRVFVPSVLVLVVVLLAVPLAFGSAFRPTFLRAMAVLVASSPCALAIATPSAVLAGIARAAREGVLVKGGGPLEILGQVCTIAFDKTGTLTEGRPRLVAVEPAEGATADELLSLAVAVEADSDHPLARAIVTDAAGFAPDMPSLKAVDVRSEVGRGVTAMVDGGAVAIGNVALFDHIAMPRALMASKDTLESSGLTTMLVCRDDRPVGLLGVMDTPRPEAAPTIERLRRLGIHRTIMLSGDNQTVADAVARQVGMDEARGGLLPADKVDAIRELSGRHSRGVAMVGDGVNDAPALASANVGIAMGAAGSAVALETADVALMGDRLDLLPFIVRLARRSTRVISQNLFISMGMVAILIPLTILGIGIGPAVIAHEGSTLVVVANALRLLAHRDGSAARDATTHRPTEA